MFLFSQQTYVPDDNFEQALIYLGYDTPPLDNYVPTKNIDTVTYLNVSKMEIKDLTGIEDFALLQVLKCDSNKLRSLDVSKNTALDSLECFQNELTSLNVSKNITLKVLWCFYNELKSLDVSKNTSLENLTCSSNQLTSLDVSKNVALKELYCNKNQLKDVDVSNNHLLVKLYCARNQLTNLNVTANTALVSLYCYNNQLVSLDVSNNHLLEEIICMYNKLKMLNVKNGNNKNMTFLAEANPELYCIQVDDPAWCANSRKWFKDDYARYSEDCGYTSVDELIPADFSIKISPNPATNYVDIRTKDVMLSEAKHPFHSVKIYDVLGVCVLTHPLAPSREGETVRLDVSGLAAGVYFVRLGGRMYKFVKM
jgi:hypothetical protein